MEDAWDYIRERSREFRRALLGHPPGGDTRVIYEECFRSLPLFCFTFFPQDFEEKYGCPLFHQEMGQSLLDKTIDRLVFTAPRNFSKSTVCVLGFGAHQACYKQRKFIIITEAAETLAIDWTTKLKGNFEENEYILRAFGNLRTTKVYDGSGTDKWTSKEFVVAHEDGFRTRFRARGTGQKIRGSNPREGRPDLFIIDDPEDLDNTNTFDLRHQNKIWLNRTVLPALPAEGGKIVVDGNMVHSAGLINSLPDSPRWTSRFYQALDSQGGSIWPGRWPLEKLEKEKEDYRARGDLASFYMEYMNIPVSEEERVFKLSKETNYHRAQYRSDGYLKMGPGEDDPVSPCRIFLGVDPGGWVGTTRDYTGLVVVAVVPDGTRYVLEALRLRIDPTQTVDQIFEVGRRYGKPARVALETIAYQEALAHYVKTRMRSENYFFPICELKPRGAKSERLLSLQPRFQIGALKISYGMGDLEEELFSFPRARHDDLLDALYFAVEASYAPPPGAIPTGRRGVPEKPRDWIVL